MPKMARNRSALHDVLAQGASNRDITVFPQIYALYYDGEKRFVSVNAYSYKTFPQIYLNATFIFLIYFNIASGQVCILDCQWAYKCNSYQVRHALYRSEYR